MSDHSHLRQLLLGLLGPRADMAAMAALSPADRSRIAQMAQEHRIAPLLHARGRELGWADALGEDLAEPWQQAHRDSAMQALVARADLVEVAQLLARAGIRAVALKGAWLAWQAYPAPALRPMRDLDLLVAPADLLPAWDLLRAAGHEPLDGPDVAASLVNAKHLPPLRAPRGTTIELHGRAYEPGGAGSIPSPDLSDHALMSRACTSDDGTGVLYPDPADMFDHLILHGVYSHGLDAGPLLLADLDYCLARFAMDWPAFWARSAGQGWDRAAALALALADHWWRPGMLAESRCPLAVPPALIEGGSDLLLQRLDLGRSRQVITTLRASGKAAPLALLARLAGTTRGDVPYWPWLMTRLGQARRQLFNREVWASGGETAAVARWISGR